MRRRRCVQFCRRASGAGASMPKIHRTSSAFATRVRERSTSRPRDAPVLQGLPKLVALTLATLHLVFHSTVIIAVVMLATAAYFYRRNHRHPKLWWTLPLCVTWMPPYAWYLLAANHSYQHAFFTYRSQLLSVLCIGLILTGTLQDAVVGTPTKNGAGFCVRSSHPFEVLCYTITVKLGGITIEQYWPQAPATRYHYDA